MWLKVGSAGALLLLLAATAMPALWTMKCYSSDRVTHMWGQAEDCMPQTAPTEGAAVGLLCCEFFGAQGNVDQFLSQAQTLPLAVPPLPEPAFEATFPSLAFSCPAAAAVAHGPPLVLANHDLSAIGRLRI